MQRIVWAILIGLFLGFRANAQPLADRVPANSLVYFGWRGTDDLGPAYADSHLKAIVDQSNFRAVIDQMLPAAMARIAKFNPQAVSVTQTIKAIAAPMYHHPTAIFLGDVVVEKQGHGGNVKVKAGLACQAGADAPQMLAEIQKLIAEIGESPDMPIVAKQDGDVVELAINYTENELPTASTGESLAKDAGFASVISNVQKDSVLCIAINFERAWSVIDHAMQLVDDPQAKEYWPKIRDASGLGGLKHIVATAAFDGQDWMQQGFIEAPAPRKGLLTLLDSKPISPDMLKAVPQNADLVLGGSFDIAKFIGVVHDAVSQVDKDAGLKVTQGLGLVSMYIGRDFQKDVLGSLGEHWVAYTSPTIAGRGALGAILINDLTDPAKAQAGLTATQMATFSTIRPFMPPYLSLRCDTIKAGDLSVSYLAVPLFSPAWAVQQKNLYVGLFPQCVISGAHFAASNGKSIADNDNFNAVRKRLGAPENLTGFSYMDVSANAGDGYQNLLMLSRLFLGAGDLFGVKSPEPVVPTLDVILPHIKPGGSISYVDDAGWHTKAVQAFPGIELFNGGNNALMSMLPQLFQDVGILLPSLNRARATANNVKDASSLRQIGLGCIMYANEHKGALPQTLGETVPYINDPHAYLRVNRADAANGAVGLPPDQMKDWVDQNSDWTYIGNGQKLSTLHNAATYVLAYAKDQAPMTPVLFADGHVEEMQTVMLQQMLMKQ